jgi:lysophospholipase L1-like esterase
MFIPPLQPAAKAKVRCVQFIVICTLAAFSSASLATPAFAGDDESGRTGRWVGSWSASPQTGFFLSDFNDQSFRMIVHSSLGGDRLRVRLSNAFGTQPLTVAAVHVGIRSVGAAIVLGSNRAVTFTGNSSVTIPQGALAISDSVELVVPALSDVAVSIFLPINAGPATTHNFGGISYLAAGDATASESGAPYTAIFSSWFLLSGVEVSASRPMKAIAALGDSITDGDGSTQGSNHRWPDELARRLSSDHSRVGVLNQGIAGNCVLHDCFGPNALARFDRDVLAQTGVKFVIVLEGINDIGNSSAFGDVSADEIILGLRQLVIRAHAKNLKIVGATLTPFEGTTIPGYFSLDGEMKREAVNEFIRTSGTFDGVIDFDQVVRDPNDPMRLLPLYDSGDHLHPNDAGYKAMGDAIDLSLFTGRAKAAD